MFTEATKEQSKLRMGIMGPAGSGKTYTALAIATRLGGKVAVRDSEAGSASKYADIFKFSQVSPQSHHPKDYVATINAAAAEGFDVLVLDSLSHAWSGKDGALELVDKAAMRSQSRNSFTAWREVTPYHNAMIDAILAAPLHIIATMRTKTEWVMEENERGKKVPRKLGMAPIQRDGMDYEFDVVGDFLDPDAHKLAITKTRCAALDGMIFEKPGEDLANILAQWLGSGEAPRAPQPADPATAGPLIDEITRLAVLLCGDEEKAASAMGRVALEISQNRTHLVGQLTDEELNAMNERIRLKAASAQTQGAKANG